MKQRVLFLCTGNSARSQMAESLFRLIVGNHIEAVSAGTHPVGLNPIAVDVMKELGVDISGQRSKGIEEFISQEFDYVITVCDRAKETCPIFPATTHMMHWSFEDPAAAPEPVRREAFRRVRDEIADRICDLVKQEGNALPGDLTCYRCDQA